jgi:hypothetical protein
MVSNPSPKARVLNILLLQGAPKIKSKYKPAVTKVLEWTKEDTGVGADMAAGSQDLKGTTALLVIAIIITINNNITLKKQNFQ